MSDPTQFGSLVCDGVMTAFHAPRTLPRRRGDQPSRSCSSLYTVINNRNRTGSEPEPVQSSTIQLFGNVHRSNEPRGSLTHICVQPDQMFHQLPAAP